MARSAAKPRKKLSVLAPEGNFSKDYLIQLEDPTAVPDSVEAAIKVDVIASALQSGVRLTGEPALTVQEVTDSGDVHLVYSAPSELNDAPAN